MYTLSKEVTVSFSSKQLFDLINDVRSYPEFLPWCHGSNILEQSGNEVIASIEVAWYGIHKTFTTKNILTPYQTINISLVAGPLRHLQGNWQLRAIDATTCQVQLELSFAFLGSTIDRLFEPLVQYITHTLVDAFIKRAEVVYAS